VIGLKIFIYLVPVKVHPLPPPAMDISRSSSFLNNYSNAITKNKGCQGNYSAPSFEGAFTPGGGGRRKTNSKVYYNGAIYPMDF
jgi:hypothetical protein